MSFRATRSGALRDRYQAEVREALVLNVDLVFSQLDREQQVRGRKLLSFLSQAFAGHARIENLLKHYLAMATPGEAHGFEAWRRIHRELSLQSRAEALSFRASVMALKVKDGRLCDMVRTVEEEIYRYENLLGDAVVDVQDLVLAEADKYLLLMRGLPASVKLHCQLHVVGHSFRNLIEAVLAYDRNTRILGDSDIGARLAATRDQSQERKSPREGDRRDRGRSPGKYGKGERRRSGSRDSQKGKGLCYNCGKTGHFARDCKEKKRESSGGKSGGPRTGVRVASLLTPRTGLATSAVRRAT